MAYITKFNISRILRKHDNSDSKVDEKLYDNSIYFFNRFEKNELLAFKAFLKDPANFVEHYYKPIDTKDTRTYVFEYEGRKPSYHKYIDCFLLHQDFKNLKIPEPIIEAGVEVEEFRKWFMTELKTAFERGAYDVVQERIRLKYNVHVSQQYFVSYQNSDVEDFNNYSIEELKTKIDHSIKEAGRFYMDHKKVLKDFSKRTYLAYKEGPIEDNETGMSDADLKSFLKYYNETYKEPVIKMLKEWYRLNFNPDVEINGTILEKLNFKACKNCYGNSDPREPLDLSKYPFNSNDHTNDNSDEEYWASIETPDYLGVHY